MLGRYGEIELRAVCSDKAIMARMAICFFGSGEVACWWSWWRFWLEEFEESEKGFPREVGGLMPKVW
jgi:hypothetical protein